MNISKVMDMMTMFLHVGKPREKFDPRDMKRRRKIEHFQEVLQPRGMKKFEGRSAWQTYKPLRIRRVGSKQK